MNKKFFQDYREQSQRKKRDRKPAGRELKPVDSVYTLMLHIFLRANSAGYVCGSLD